MAYDTDKLALVYAPIGGGYPRVFTMQTSTDAAAITGAGWFSDGASKGMRAGDLVDVVVVSTAPKYTRYQVLSVSGAAATVQASSAIA